MSYVSHNTPTQTLVAYYQWRVLVIFCFCSLAPISASSAAQLITWDDDIAELSPVSYHPSNNDPELSVNFLKIRQFKWDNNTYRRQIVSRDQNLLLAPIMNTEVATPIVLKADYLDYKLTDPILFFQWEVKDLNAENQLDEASQITRSSLLKAQFDKPGTFRVTLSVQNTAGKVLVQNWELKVASPKKGKLYSDQIPHPALETPVESKTSQG